MGLLEIIVLAIVQGLTEFLPVSSSGHLVVAAAGLEALGYTLPPEEEVLAVEIVLHLGTLGAILAYFWRPTLQLIGRDRRLIPLLVVGTIPAAVVGVPLKQFASEALVNPLLAGYMFPVTAALLIWASRQRQGAASYRDLTWWGALQVGLFQALALLPGISRSGATIAGGLGCGLDRRSAGVFAFLLAIPAMLGAGVLEIKDLVEHSLATSAPAMLTAPLHLVIGAIVAMLVGLAALAWLVRWIEQGRLALFAWYLLPLSAIVVGWQLFAVR